MSTNIAILVRQKLLIGLPAEVVEVEDESYKHAGHAGNSGGHAYLRVRIVAKAFAGKSLVAQGQTAGRVPRYFSVKEAVFPFAKFRGSDMVCRALAGMVHLMGPAEGPPLVAPDHQAAVIGGVTGFIAVMAALIAREAGL